MFNDVYWNCHAAWKYVVHAEKELGKFSNWNVLPYFIVFSINDYYYSIVYYMLLNKKNQCIIAKDTYIRNIIFLIRIIFDSWGTINNFFLKINGFGWMNIWDAGTKRWSIACFNRIQWMKPNVIGFMVYFL